MKIKTKILYHNNPSIKKSFCYIIYGSNEKRSFLNFKKKTQLIVFQIFEIGLRAVRKSKRELS